MQMELCCARLHQVFVLEMVKSSILRVEKKQFSKPDDPLLTLCIVVTENLESDVIKNESKENNFRTVLGAMLVRQFS